MAKEFTEQEEALLKAIYKPAYDKEFKGLDQTELENRLKDAISSLSLRIKHCQIKELAARLRGYKTYHHIAEEKKQKEAERQAEFEREERDNERRRLQRKDLDNVIAEAKSPRTKLNHFENNTLCSADMFMREHLHGWDSLSPIRMNYQINLTGKAIERIINTFYQLHTNGKDCEESYFQLKENISAYANLEEKVLSRNFIERIDNSLEFIKANYQKDMSVNRINDLASCKSRATIHAKGYVVIGFYNEVKKKKVKLSIGIQSFLKLYDKLKSKDGSIYTEADEFYNSRPMLVLPNL